MITLTRKQQIIMSHLAGTSNRQIAAKLHISKDTVNKYVKEYDAQRAELLIRDPDADSEEILQAFVRLYTGKLIVYHEGSIVAVHNRSFLPHDWTIDIYHYLRTLKRKPGALPGSTALLQSDAVVNCGHI